MDKQSPSATKTLMDDIFSYKASDFTEVAEQSGMLLPIVIGLLIVSNIFMSFAWYHHLKKPGMSFIIALSISLIYVVFEYAANIHANAIGYKHYDVYTLKILQEAITLMVFTGFAIIVFGDYPSWRHAGAFALVIGAVWLCMDENTKRRAVHNETPA